MAPGTALAVPRLALAALEPFQPSNTYSGAFGLARNLLLAGVGHPEDWEVARGDPVAFMLRTVERDVASFNRKAIDGVAHVDILFGTSPYISSWHEKDYENPDRVFLAVEATQISIVYLRPTLELLAKVHPRLPATFYRTLLEGVSSWILSYDESACEAFYEWRLEAYEEAKESGEEGLEKPQSIETAKGSWLTRRYKPLPATKANAVIETLKPRTQARAILDAIRRLHTLAKARERTRPHCDMWDEYYPNGSFLVPFTILAFHEQDLVCQAFQSDEEDWMNGGEQQSPAFATAFSPNDPDSIANGFGEFRHFLRMMEAMGELLALLPGCDVLEEQK
jgi:PRTRC genetic system protein F